MPAPSSLNALRITNKIKADFFLADFLQLLRTNFAVVKVCLYAEKLTFEHNFQIHTSYIIAPIVPCDRYLCGVLYITH